MTGVGFDRLRLFTAERIELPHQFRIADEAVGRGDVLHSMLFPQAVGVAERGETALRGHARPGENEQARALLAERRHPPRYFFHQLSFPMA